MDEVEVTDSELVEEGAGSETVRGVDDTAEYPRPLDETNDAVGRGTVAADDDADAVDDAADGADDVADPVENGDGGPSGFEPRHDAAVYDTVVDLSDDNDAHSLIVKLVGKGKRVLELGCATGSTTKVLQQLGCSVVAIEIDGEAAEVAAPFAERMIVADLDLLDVPELLGEDTFDVIIAADVLEHLRDPQRLLTACLGHLRPDGEVLLSIPNIAHADVRLSLLRGDFDYQWCGILDETHLRFFTRRSLATFLADCGLAPLTWDRTQRAVGETEIWWRPVDDEELLAWVAAQPDADTYQFIVRAVAAPDGSHLREVVSTLTEAQSELETLYGLRTEAQRAAEDNARLTEDNERLVDGVAKLELLVAELQTSSKATEATLARTQADAKAASEQLRHVWRQVDGLTTERDRYRTSFDMLAGVHEELVAVRRSESYKIGNLLLSPITSVRRFVRAWRRAEIST